MITDVRVRRVTAVALLALAACGTPTGADAGNDVISAPDVRAQDAAVESTGVVAIIQTTAVQGMGTVNVASLQAQFAEFTGGSGCITQEQSPCRVVTCNSLPGQRRIVSAGVLTFAGGTGDPVLMAPETAGQYSPVMETDRWSPGEAVEISAAGDVVPAFNTTLTFPSRPTVTAPVPSMTTGEVLIERVSGLRATWTGGTAAEVAVVVQQTLRSGASRNISCAFTAANGAGSIPASLLMALMPSDGSDTTIVSVAGTSRENLTVGSFRVTATIVWIGIGANATLR